MLRDHPVDAILLTTAALDRDATKLYALDTRILLREKLEEMVSEFRRSRDMPKLSIESPFYS